MHGFRRGVAVALAAGLLTFAAGCGDDEEDAGGESAASNSNSAETDLSGQSVTFVSFGGNLQEAEMAAFVTPWAEETGADASEDSPSDYAKLKTQVDTGNVSWDVMHADPFFIIANCGTLFEEIDTSVVTSLSEVPSDLVSSKCEVPHMRYGIGLYYDNKQFGSDPPTSWADFFDTEKYPGKRGAWGYSQSGLIEAALLADGVAPEELYPLDLDRAFAKLDTLKSDIKFSAAPGEVAQSVTSGDVSMALIYTGRAYDAAKQGADWKMVWDAPTITSYEAVGVVKGTQNADAAFSLANAFGEAEPQARFAEQIAYAPTNEQAEPELDELLEEYSVASHSEDGYVALDQAWWAENFDAANQAFTDWQAG